MKAIRIPSASATALALCLCTCASGWAQSWRLTPQIQATVTATDNAVYGDEPEPRKDAIFDITPSLGFIGRGAQYRVQGEMALHGLVYARDSQPNRLLPSGKIALESTLLPQWLYLDSNFSTEQTAVDPYGAQPDAQSTANRLTTTQWLISPSLRHEFSPTVALLVRSDQEWIWRSGDTGDVTLNDSRSQFNLLRLERKPTPYGIALEAAQQDTRYSGTTALSSRSARLIASWQPDPQMQFGLVGGTERSRFSLTEHTDAVYGLRADLAPTERTRIQASVERRYFGTGWDLTAQHRSPFLAFSARLLRQATAQTASTVFGAGSNPSSLLDSMLVTRYPDPVARAAVVNDLVAKLGLPNELGQPVEVFTEAPQLEQGVDLSLAFMGRVTVVSFGLYTRHIDQLQRKDDPLPPIAGYAQANRQIGATFGFNRRLSPLSAVDLLLEWSRLEGIGLSEGDETKQWQARLALTHDLSPRSNVTFGVRHRELESTLGEVRSAHESAVFVALGHRF